MEVRCQGERLQPGRLPHSTRGIRSQPQLDPLHIRYDQGEIAPCRGRLSRGIWGEDHYLGGVEAGDADHKEDVGADWPQGEIRRPHISWIHAENLYTASRQPPWAARLGHSYLESGRRLRAYRGLVISLWISQGQRLGFDRVRPGLWENVERHGQDSGYWSTGGENPADGAVPLRPCLCPLHIFPLVALRGEQGGKFCATKD